VDIWGGYQNRQTRTIWKADTLVQIFSATKGFAALALSVAHSKGYIDYDERVCSYWPEFAQNGKENITVRQLLAHQAGLSPLDKLHINRLEDLDTSRLSLSLSDSKPAWEVGKFHGYHTWTIGAFSVQGGLLGHIRIEYTWDGKRYQAKSLAFKPVQSEY
jgi:CubicO group peptidase (beta-lactamase class C family)